MGNEYANLKKQRCLQLVQECAHSGKSKREWCAENGIGYSTFIRWQKRLRDELAGELLAPQEIVPVQVELPEQEQICAKCSSAMVRIGEKFVRSELVIVPAQVYVVDYYAASYKCAHCEAQTGESYIRQAQAPVPVMKKSMAAPSTVGATYSKS